MINKLFCPSGVRYALIHNRKWSFQVAQNLSNFAKGKQIFLKSGYPSLMHLNVFQKPSFRCLTTSSVCYEDENANEEPTKPKKIVDPLKDRSKVIPVELSMRYLKSKAYETTYGQNPVWTKYRRNFKGPYPPRETRETCIRAGIIAAGNPCPICRDEYLVIHYTNTDLLKQFISPYTGEVFTAYKTGICRKKQMDMEVAIEKAKFYGLITFDVPFREYDYSEFYPQLRKTESLK